MKIQPSLPWLFQTDEGRLCQVAEVEEGLGNFHAMMPATCRNNGIYTPVKHSNGKSTIWRCISYSKWGVNLYSRGVLVLKIATGLRGQDCQGKFAGEWMEIPPHQVSFIRRFSFGIGYRLKISGIFRPVFSHIFWLKWGGNLAPKTISSSWRFPRNHDRYKGRSCFFQENAKKKHGLFWELLVSTIGW